MNEELTKELLSILRAMKDGAPHAWETLVQQRSTYCMTMGISLSVLASVATIFVATGLSLAGKGLSVAPVAVKNEYGEDRFATPPSAVAKATAGIILSVVGAISACVCIPNAVMFIAEGLAPLGRVLEAIR